MVYPRSLRIAISTELRVLTPSPSPSTFDEAAGWSPSVADDGRLPVPAALPFPTTDVGGLSVLATLLADSDPGSVGEVPTPCAAPG